MSKLLQFLTEPAHLLTATAAAMIPTSGSQLCFLSAKGSSPSTERLRNQQITA